MEAIQWILSGIGGTVLMTMWTNGLAAITGKRWLVIRILSTMLTMRSIYGELTDSRRALLIGTIVHYAIGVLFALLFAFLVRNEVFGLTLTSVLLFGALVGLVAIVVWRSFISLHPAPPAIPVKSYLVVIGIGHIVFALGLAIFRVLVFPGAFFFQ